MDLYSLIGKLEDKGIKLFLKDGQLKVKAAKDSLTPELLQEISVAEIRGRWLGARRGKGVGGGVRSRRTRDRPL